jgi:hypothetical protein
MGTIVTHAADMEGCMWGGSAVSKFALPGRVRATDAIKDSDPACILVSVQMSCDSCC